MTPALLQKEITVAGIRLRYLEREPASPTVKAPLLLLHQLLATAETWGEIIAQLPTDRRIVAFDLLSAKPLAKGAKLDVHFDSLTRLLLAFLRDIHLESPVILGHSHGGTLGLCLAVSGELNVQGLVLLSPAHPYGGYREHVVNFYIRRLGRTLAQCIPYAPTWAIHNAYKEATGPKGAITRAQMKLYMGILRSRRALRRVLEMMRTWEDDMNGLRAEMEREPVTLPTLVIWGDADPVVYVSSAEALVQQLPRGELITLPGIGHLLCEEAPQECSRLINEWLLLQETHQAIELGIQPATMAG